MPQPKQHDVFISHSSADDAWAQAALAALEGVGLDCWIAPRDILAGETWAGAIVDAIHRCRLMLLILSRDSNASDQVTRELSQAAERGVRVLPLRVDDVLPSSDKAYYLGAAHWRTVLGGPTQANLAQLLEDVRRLLELSSAPSEAEAGPASPPSPPVAVPAVVHHRKRLVAGAVVGLAVLASAWIALDWARHPKPDGRKPDLPRNDHDQHLPGPRPPPPGPADLGKDPQPAKEKQPVDGPSDPAPAPDAQLWATAPASLRDAFEPVTAEWRETGGKSLPVCIRHRGTGIVFLLVPGGRFSLGSNAGAPDVENDEFPPRKVELTPFYIARHETTVAQWTGDAAKPAEPVVGKVYSQVEDWCAQHGLALPTEAQWEYAASGPENRLFPWGDAWDAERCNAAGAADGHRELAPVASYRSKGESWCEAEDMAGNASEWCRGFYTNTYADFSGEVDPEPPAHGTRRPARGGSWSDRSANLRTSDRRGYELGLPPNGYIGFRCVFEP